MTDKHENSVLLLGHYGSDKTHALSAWCSTFEELGITIPEEVDERIDTIFDYVKKTKKRAYNELLTALAGDGHHTPFEKSSLHFLVTSDIASHIHKLKHRIGVSINSESARYKELMADKFYVPVDWPEEEKQRFTEYALNSFKEYHAAVDRLNEYYISEHLKGKDLTDPMVESIHRRKANQKARKRSKESARFYLPYGMQYTVDIQFNFRSFMHFQSLRNSDHAQLEIKHIAKDMLKQVFDLPGNPFQYSLRAFGYTEESCIK